MEAGSSTPNVDPLRQAAVARLGKKREFRSHLLLYMVVNGCVVVIWAIVWGITGMGFFWPALLLIAWAPGLAADGLDTYKRPPLSEKGVTFSEDEIGQEMNRLRGRDVSQRQEPSLTARGRSPTGRREGPRQRDQREDTRP